MFSVALPILILPLAAAALSLSGCAAPTAGGSSLLAETRWRFTAIDGAPPVSPVAHLEFHSDRIGAKVGCNGMGGPWRIEHGRLIAGPLVSTEMWCEGKMEQERAVSALLVAAPEIKVGAAHMKLTSGGHSAELVSE